MKALIPLLFLFVFQSYSQSPDEVKSGDEMENANRSPRAHEQYRLGLKHYNKGDYKLALTFFQMAEGMDENATDAEIYIKKINDTKDSTKVAGTSRKQPEPPSTQVDDIERYYYLGVTSVRNNENERAKRYFEKTLALDTNHRKAHVSLGNLYLDMEERLKAVPHLELAHKQDSTDLKVARTLMDIYKDLGADYRDSYILYKKRVDSMDASNGN